MQTVETKNGKVTIKETGKKKEIVVELFDIDKEAREWGTLPSRWSCDVMRDTYKPRKK